MAGSTMPAIVPAILSGGSGTRLWPMSVPARPKQFLALGSGRTLFQEAAARVVGDGFLAPIVICNREHRFLVAEQLREMDVAPLAVALEAEPRNTAPAAAVAALLAAERAPGALVLLLPSDHVVRRPERFRAAIMAGAEAAAQGALVVFGIAPDRPHTGYGYIRTGEPIPGADGCARVRGFVEKPDRARAESYLPTGDYLWNAGIFLFRPDVLLAELERLSPAIYAAAREAVAKGANDLDFFRLDAATFAACPAGPLDKVVMEKTANAAVVPVNMGWSDAGSWAALWEAGDKDGAGNVRIGPVVAYETAGCYLHSEGPTIGVMGLGDVTVIATEDAVLVAPRERAEEVRTLAGLAEATARADGLTRTTVHRPWGSFKTLRIGERFQVKQITVKPGGALSLQYHQRRAEHWVIVSGRARVWRGEEIFVLEENQSTYIPVGVRHRLENAGEGPLHLIEVQSGDYLGEDDIVRLEDLYGRI